MHAPYFYPTSTQVKNSNALSRIPVPATLDNDAFETLRLEIEKRMRDNQEGDDRKRDWGETLF